MKEWIKDFFSSAENLERDSTGSLTPRAVQIATCVILLELAYSDGKFDPSEFISLVNTLCELFAYSEAEANELMKIAEQMREMPGECQNITEQIRNSFELPQKQNLMRMVWKIILSDEKVDQFETRYATQLRVALGLSLEQASSARMFAEHEQQ